VRRAARFGPVFGPLAIGAAIAALAQLALPHGVPLYDGAIVPDPYRYLSPGPGQTGNPSAYAADLPVSNGQSPQITAATTENPPQAQLIALAGTFAVPAGVATIHVSITPVSAAVPATIGALSGNVYRVAVTSPDGAELAISGSQRPTLAMRGAAALADAAIARDRSDQWQRLETVANAALAVYTVEPDALGDFAIVDLAGGGPSSTDLVVAGTVVIVVAAIAFWAFRTWRRRRALAAEPVGPTRSRRPPPSRRAPPPRRRR
jgi:hypothetical protein